MFKFKAILRLLTVSVLKLALLLQTLKVHNHIKCHTNYVMGKNDENGSMHLCNLMEQV